MDTIKVRKRLSNIQQESRRRAKQDICCICGKTVTSFCNSHSIPRFVLERIARDGQVLNGAYALDLPFVHQQDGVNRSGTFYLLCNDCDNMFFSDYENENALLDDPTTRSLAQIDLKNVLLQLSKRYYEVELYDVLQERTSNLHNKIYLDTIHSLDIRDYLFDFRRAMKIITKNLKSGYDIVYSELLPYVVPIATQSGITMTKDMENNTINDIYNDSPDNRIQTMHCCVFPLKDKTRILLFHHKDDRNYKSFDRQFAKLSKLEKLQYINYLIFKYTDNYFAAPELTSCFSTEMKLKQLCRENGDLPDLGFVPMMDDIIPYQPVAPDEIPNFLSEDHKLH